MPNPFIAFIVVVILLLGSLFTLQQNQKSLLAEPGTPLVEFSLPDVSGNIQSISNWHDKILIINFWATWCPPCLKEIPEFIELQTEYAEHNVQFIGIAIDDPQQVANYLSLIEINYPVLIAETQGGKLSKSLGNTVQAIPFTLIVNQQQQIIFRNPGELSKQQLRELITPLITPAGVNSNGP